MRRDVQRSVDFRRVDPAAAQRLLAAYLPIVRAVARLYPASEQAELESVGRLAIMEAFVSFDEAKAAEATWVSRIVHWRLAESAKQQPEDSTLTGRADVFEGHEIQHDPERSYFKGVVLDNLRALPPRQSTVILAFLQGETFAEIGASLGISAQHAHVEYKSAVKHLRKLVSDG